MQCFQSVCKIMYMYTCKSLTKQTILMILLYINQQTISTYKCTCTMWHCGLKWLKKAPVQPQGFICIEPSRFYSPLPPPPPNQNLQKLIEIHEVLLMWLFWNTNAVGTREGAHSHPLGTPLIMLYLACHPPPPPKFLGQIKPWASASTDEWV